MNFRTLVIMLASLCLFCGKGRAQHPAKERKASIVIEVELPKDFKKNGIVLQAVPYDYVVIAQWKSRDPEIRDNLLKWTLQAEQPLNVSLKLLSGLNIYRFYEPGDSIHIDFKAGEDRPVYSGRGTGKFNMQQEMLVKEALLNTPKNESFGETASVEDYLEWNRYLNAKLEIMDALLVNYKDQMTKLAKDYISGKTIVEIEYQRGMKFGDMIHWPADKAIPGAKLGQIFDSTMVNKYAKWLHSNNTKVGNPYYFYDFVRKSVQRKYNFNTEHAALKGAGRKILYAELGRKIYTGMRLQNFLVYLLTGSGLKEHTFKDGYTPEIEQLLNEFYAMPGYPEHKAYVKGYEEMIREWVIHTGGNAPDFNLKGSNGKEYSKKGFKDKILLLSFYDDSKESAEMLIAIRKVQTVFANHRDVAFLNVFCGVDNAGRQNILSVGKEHSMLKYYNVKAYPEFNVKAYPRLFLLDNRGQFVYNGEFGKDNGGPLKRNAKQLFPDPTKDKGQALINDIYEQLARMKDGPYVFHGKDGTTAYSINSSNVAKQRFPAKSVVKITAGTDDLLKTFPFQLKNKLALEPSVTALRPEKLFVLSDIEGDFEAFRKLLQANKIIDDRFNWTFGNGHLVFAGDMFDRGLQVTECLWLVYALEEKAKKAGGYVHFILGNHEIMNLQGDHRYVDQKYKDNAALMGKTLVQLYNEDSELGRWLRTKNIVEKIGDLLFAHGGISAEMSRLKLTIAEINELARPNYANSQTDYKDVSTNVIMSSKIGPFWYRGYYGSEGNVYKASGQGVDSILQHFKVRHIITGHTIVADTISTHYNHKVINTDTKHASAKSEALLIEGANFYRVNQEGKRVLLFKEEEK